MDQGLTSSAPPPETMPGGSFLIHDKWKPDTDQFGNLVAFRYSVKDDELVPS